MSIIDPSNNCFSRRSFLLGAALLAASSTGILSCKNNIIGKNKILTGRIMGANHKSGHRLLEKERPSPIETEEAGLVIVGGGIAGLSAVRELLKRRFSDFLLLELEEKVGGNSTSGVHAASPFPWGAHYVPIPGKESVFVTELFEELGIIEGYDSKGLPVYNEEYLCADPHERLFMFGQWQEGLIPRIGISEDDSRQYSEFFAMMTRFKKAIGSDGRPAFTVPLDLSSRDSRFLKYDLITMEEFMDYNNWNSEYLRWYVNYCCRDDYGSTIKNTSAWAGLHYFASRSGIASNAEPSAVVTWPEGNGWLVSRLAEKAAGNIRSNACVLNIEEHGDGLSVDYYDSHKNSCIRIRTKAVIYAAPRHTALRTIKEFREKRPEYADSFGYAPWMVANIVTQAVPKAKGAALSWDNVCYNSEFLGYVVANHQNVAVHREKTILTYYFPLTAGEPAAERQRALNTPFEAWADMVIKDISSIHPGIENSIEEINVWLWGHAMIRPVPGFIWGAARREALKPLGKIYFGHSDMSGISIFEEAQYRGIKASRAALKEVIGL